ncbi:peptide chain release factor 1-like, mitochondrial isoform X1 [Pseudophryne corroboree]|uniref:peptide chain release factor 1-like, mitochondrial isoform X1 n=1 Tax=Pseudophryne corroboree TaxID=495146 RepID=UPI00308141DF
MLASLARCVQNAGITRSLRHDLCDALYRLPGVLCRRTAADTRRLSALEEVTRSAAWPGYLKRLKELEAAEEVSEDLQVTASSQVGDTSGSRRSNTWEMKRVFSVIQELREKESELEQLHQLLGDENEDLKALAKTEITSCLKEINELNCQIAWFLIPREEVDACNPILEVTAGVGGQEAMLFTSDIFDMYQRYAAHKNWSFDILEYFHSDLGGVRRASAIVGGHNVYKHLKYEGGVHRVQRVPKTEKQGRIHTSTMTVAVLPQPNEINLIINPKDLRIETKRASGAGGQHVNTTDSAVRIVHIPTGVVSECQQERSQTRNKETAMKVLRAKLYNIKLEEETNKYQMARKIQVGTKGRSEKIRTYNFPQDRVTDHRIGKSVHSMEGFLLGDELLDEMIQDLSDFAIYESLMEIISNEHL